MSDNALSAANYTLDGQALPTGTVLKFVGNKATVNIVLPDNTYSKDETKKLVISKNVTTGAGKSVVADTTTKAQVERLVSIFDNIEPTLKSAAYDVVASTDTTSNKVRLTFSEAIAFANNSDNLNDLKVVVAGKQIAVTAVAPGSTADTVTLTLGEAVNVKAKQLLFL